MHDRFPPAMQDLILYHAKFSLTGAKMLDAWQVKKIQLAKYLTPRLDAKYLCPTVKNPYLSYLGKLGPQGGG